MKFKIQARLEWFVVELMFLLAGATRMRAMGSKLCVYDAEQTRRHLITEIRNNLDFEYFQHYLLKEGFIEDKLKWLRILCISQNKYFSMDFPVV